MDNNAGAIDKRELNLRIENFCIKSFIVFAAFIRIKKIRRLKQRIINITSNVHKNYDIDINDLQNEIKYTGWKAYCRSKLLNILITYSFKKELNTNINCNCLHPGFVNSNFGNNNKNFYRFLIRFVKNLFAISNEKASLSPLYIATSKNLDGVNGKYFDKLKEVKSSKVSYDNNLQKIIW